MSSFCDTFDLTSLIKKPTCYKNLDNPSCIDLILTKKPLSFQNSCVVDRGGSRAAGTSKMECFVIIVKARSRCLLSQSAPSWMLQQP